MIPRHGVVASVALVLGCGGAAPTGDATVEIAHYELALDLISRATQGTLTATATSDGNCFALADATRALTDVRVNGEAATTTYTADDNTELTICGPGFYAGDALTISYRSVIPAETLGASQVGFSSRSVGGGNFYYMLNWVAQCARLGICDPAPDRFATYRFVVAHPAELTVLCPGDISTSPTQTICNFSSAGGPLYSTMGIIAYDRWTSRSLGTWDGVAVTGFERAGGRVLDVIDADYFANFMAWMSERFGPYPYGDELRIVVAPTYWAGFEHPGNIVLDDALVSALGGDEDAVHTLLHEIVHQWAGDQTTLASTYDFVWKEAMAEYLSFVYEDETDGELARLTRAGWKAYSNGAAYHPVPEEQPALFTYYGHVYGPGPMVLFRQLERLTSRDDVLAALQTLLGAQRALSVDEVLAALEQTTELSLDAYADAWIYGTGAPAWPRIQLTGGVANGFYKLTAQVTNAQAVPLACRFSVGLMSADQSESQLVSVDLWNDGAPIATWEADLALPSFEVASLVLDPNHECLVYPAASLVTMPRGVNWSPWVTENRYRPGRP